MTIEDRKKTLHLYCNLLCFAMAAAVVAYGEQKNLECLCTLAITSTSLWKKKPQIDRLRLLVFHCGSQKNKLQHSDGISLAIQWAKPSPCLPLLNRCEKIKTNKKRVELTSNVRALSMCRAPLLEECLQHHGHKGDLGVMPGTCGTIGERAQVILVWVRAPGCWKRLPPTDTRSHEG